MKIQRWFASRATKHLLLAAAVVMAGATGARGQDQGNGCSLPQSVVNKVLNQLAVVVQAPDQNGGLFSPNRMWAAVVDRQGVLCGVTRSDPDAWPGSRDIAIAKASTANDFSNDKLALSTANLYGPTQPGGSLYGLNNSNPFNPAFNAQGTGIGSAVGGIITFGGGVALYTPGGQVIGGLGVSGDSSCADHVIAFRMRHNAGYGTVPGGVGPGNTDDINYYGTAPLTSPDMVDPSQFAQPHCFSSDLTTPTPNYPP
jgi:uncharacterized protein GlcG (DUF336 family)